MDGLYQHPFLWLQTGQPPSANVHNKYELNPATRVLLSKAMSTQTQIGWSQVPQGYLSRQWLLAQHSEFPRSLIQGLRQTCLCLVVLLALWRFYIAMREHRNSILHETTISALAIRESPIDTKIQQLYNNEELFAATDRVLFSIPLSRRLFTSWRSKKHWLPLVSWYQLTTTTWQIGDQLLLTKFFTRRSTTPTIPIDGDCCCPQALPSIQPRSLNPPAKPG